MKKGIISLCILAFLVFTSGAVLADGSKMLNVVMDDNYPPYIFRDASGHLQGILVDQWALWEKKTGIKVNISAMDWGKAQERMQNGDFDVIDTIFNNPQRARIYDFSRPYATIDVRIYFHKNISGIDGIESLKGFKVGVKKGDSSVSFLRKRGINDLVEFNSYEDIVRAAKDQRIMIFVMDKPPALYFLYKMGIQDQFRASNFIYSGQFHRAVRKGNTEILKEVEDGFNKISGAEYASIDERWMGSTLIGPESVNRLIIALGAVCIVVLGLGFWSWLLKEKVRSKTVELTSYLEALKRSEEKYRGLLTNLDVGIIVYGPTGDVVLRNREHLSLQGIDERSLSTDADINADILFIHEDGCKILSAELPVNKVITKQVPVHDYVIGIVRHNQSDTVWIQASAFPEFNAEGKLEQIIVTIVDVTELKRAEQLQRALYRISESSRSTNNLDELYRDVHQAIGKLIMAVHFYIAIYDEAEQMIEFPYSTDVYHKSKSSRRFGKGLTEYVLRTERALYVDREQLEKLINAEEVIISARSIKYWHGVPLKTTDNKTFGVLAIQGYDEDFHYKKSDDEILGFISAQVAMAIQRKAAEEKLIYLSYHDYLTNLFNRAYFEQELKRLEMVGNPASLGIIIFDVDGLKLVNDTFGHDQGDALLVRAAGILQQSLGEENIISRIGGDEFAAIMINVTEESLGMFCTNVKNAIAKESDKEDKDAVLLHISMGYAISAEKISLHDAFRIADNRMYRDKLHRKKNTRGNIIQTLKQMLAERDFITEGHAERLLVLAEKLASAAGMQESEIADLTLFAQFHDIGKVGISDRILNKPNLLTAEERQEMQRHCEIGHRIALSSPDLTPIADWILKHQEWWNGKGYPLGLAGESIPLECRILAIVDAYDAMTNDRPYRKAMDRRIAIDELKRCAGTQFDPDLVKIFCKLAGELDG